VRAFCHRLSFPAGFSAAQLDCKLKLTRANRQRKEAKLNESVFNENLTAKKLFLLLLIHLSISLPRFGSTQNRFSLLNPFTKQIKKTLGEFALF
jgi:hypothetical protein